MITREQDLAAKNISNFCCSKRRNITMIRFLLIENEPCDPNVFVAKFGDLVGSGVMSLPTTACPPSRAIIKSIVDVLRRNSRSRNKRM